MTENIDIVRRWVSWPAWTVVTLIAPAVLIHVWSILASEVPEPQQCLIPEDPSDCEQFLEGSGQQLSSNPYECAKIGKGVECYLYEVNNGLREPIPEREPTSRDYVILYLALGSGAAFFLGEALGVLVTVLTILGFYWLRPSERVAGFGVAATIVFAGAVSGPTTIVMFAIMTRLRYLDFSAGIPW